MFGYRTCLRGIRCVRSLSTQTNLGGPRPEHSCRVIVVTSGKGGVGKTTSSASIAYGLAERGHKTVAIDFDIGLRNLDLHLGMERRVVFDFVNVILGESSLNQSMIRDRHNENLYLLAASQTKDKSVLTEGGVGAVMNDLRSKFDFVICDSPAGIENGAFQAMFFADEAILCTNPELSSVRDSDKMLGLISSKSFRAVHDLEPVKQSLLITRYQPEKVEVDGMLSYSDIVEMLGVPLIGVVPESEEVLESTNVGRPVIARTKNGRASEAYQDIVSRILGETLPFRFISPERSSSGGIFSRFFK